MNPKIIYAGTPDEPFFSELWSSHAYETMRRTGLQVQIPDFSFSKATPERWHKFAAGAEGVITTWHSPCIDNNILSAAPELRIMGHAAGSLAGYVSPELFAAGVKVTSANNDMAFSVAEWCLMGALTGQRRVNEYAQFGKNGRLDFVNRTGCRTVRDAIIGIWGFGAVAEQLVGMLKPLLPRRIVVNSAHLDAATAAELGVELGSFTDVLRHSDILFTLAGLNAKTECRIGAAELEQMKDGMLLVNGGRGQLIAEEALLTELTRGRIFAVLDVFHREPLEEDSVLRRLDNVILTPHNAGYPSRSCYIGTVLEEFSRFFRGEKLLYETAEAKVASMTVHPAGR